MTVEQLKVAIANENLSPALLILDASVCPFLAHQYISAIKSIIADMCDVYDDISAVDVSYGFMSEDTTKIVYVDSFKETTGKYLNKQRVIIFVNKSIDKETEKLYNSYIVKFDKLTDWQIKDYIFSETGMSNECVENLFSICGGDIYRIDMEIQKLKIFGGSDSDDIFKEMVSDKQFADISTYTIFSLTNALVTSNSKEVLTVLKEIDNIDINVFAFITTLYNSFNNVISIQMSKNPTPESTGMKQGQFNAIKYHNINFFRNGDLVDILKTVGSMDYMIKSGKIPQEIVIDYICNYILSKNKG